MVLDQKQLEALKLLSSLSDSASETQEFPHFLASISQRISQTTGFEKLVLAIPWGESEFELYDCEGGECQRKSLASSGSSFQAAMVEGKPVADFSLGKFSQYFDMRKLQSEGYKSCITFPFYGKIGAISFISRGKDKLGQGEEELLKAIAGSIGLFVKSVASASGKEDATRMCSIVFDSSSEAVFIAEPSGKIVSANERASDLSGFSSEDLSQRSLFDFYPESRDVVERVSRAKGGGMQEFVSLFRKKSGEAFVRTRIRAVKDDKKPLLVFSCLDVTEGLLSGAYEGLLYGFGDISFAIDAEKRFISISNNIQQLLGYSKEELVGEPFATIVATKDNTLINELISWMKDKSEKVDGLEMHIVSRSGSARAFLLGARGFFDSSGKLMRIHGILRDIEQVKKATGQESFYSEMLEDLSDAVWGADEGGYVRYWNKAAERLLGYPKGEITGKDARIIFPPEKEWELPWALGGKGFAKSYDSQRAKKDGELAEFRVTSKLVKDQSGKTIGYVEILRDTELEKRLKEAEKRNRDLEGLNKKLRERNDLEAAFVSNVSHEIRTPLTNIHGYSLLVQEDAGKLNPEHRKYVDIIASETERLRRLINDVLDMSRLDSMRFKLEPREFELSSLQEKCSCTYLAEKKGLYVNWELEDGLPGIYADPIRISQVLINLISNAIKFTEKGGITVRASRKGRTSIQVDVIDTGEGIPDSELASIFKRFYQTSGGKKRGGTGLGLAITKQIIELHGGKVWATSKVGEGSVFSFTLPTKKKTPRGTRKKAPALKSEAPSSSSSQAKAEPDQKLSADSGPPISQSKLEIQVEQKQGQPKTQEKPENAEGETESEGNARPTALFF